MIYYKNLKMLNKSIKSWLKMGITTYSVFPVKGGYLLHLNLMEITFEQIGEKMKTYTYNELSQKAKLEALWNCLRYYDYILIQMLNKFRFTKKGKVTHTGSTMDVLI